MTSIASKIGCRAETLRKWVRQDERDAGQHGILVEYRAQLRLGVCAAEETRYYMSMLSAAHTHYAVVTMTQNRSTAQTPRWLSKCRNDIPSKMMRPLNSIERNPINRFAEKLTGGSRAQLMDDLTKVAVESDTDDGSRVVFEIAGYERPPYRGQHAFEVEGRMVDADGPTLLCGYMLMRMIDYTNSNSCGGTQGKSSIRTGKH